jgi:putative hemolysin
MSEITFEIIVILLLILVNGLFAMSELAIVSSRRVRLQQMARDGNVGAEVALALAETPNRFLSTVQVGITLVGIFAGAIGGATLSQSLVPKRVALVNTERIASIVARPMHTLSVITWPLVRFLSLATDLVLKIIRLEAKPKTALTEDEIRLLVEQGAQAGIIEEVEREMVESVFLLDDRPLEAIMTPRPEIIWLDVNAPNAEIRRIVKGSSHSRFPVCDGELDKALGLVRAKDLLAESLGSEEINLRQVMQKPLFAPENARALQVLERFRETGIHLAMLVDEYGGIEGLVTSFDILEAIVGDIPTMDEIKRPPIVQREDGSWLVDGLIAVDDFKRAFKISVLPGEGSYQTLGGFVVFMLGSVPGPGNYFGYGGFRYEVADMDGRRVDKVILSPGPDVELSAEEQAINP